MKLEFITNISKPVRRLQKYQSNSFLNIYLRGFSSSISKSATPTDDFIHIPPSGFLNSTSQGPIISTRPASTSTNHLESNVSSETNRLEKTSEKFWEKVSVGSIKNISDQRLQDFVILLDNKSIKTPEGHSLVIPRKKPILAHLIAHEWSILPSLKIKPHLVPLTSLASRAVDLASGNTQEAIHVANLSSLENITENLLPYLDTDTLLVFSPNNDCEGKLRIAQEKEYRSFISVAENFWSKFSTSRNPISLSWLDTETMGFASNKQSHETKEAVANWISSLNVWELVSLERATMSAKSLIIGMLITTGKISISEAVRVATLETVYQTELWGEVQDSHDVDFHDLQRLLGSAYILASEK